MARLTKISALVVHCDATPPTHNWDIDDLRAAHKRRGFNDVGYHFFIRRDGTIQKGRSTSIQGAHAKTAGYNRKSLGICLAGGVDSKLRAENNFTSLQFNSLRWLLEQLLRKYPDVAVIGHRDTGAKKACPSFDVAEFLAGPFTQCPAKPASVPDNLLG